MGKRWNSVRLYFFFGSKITADGDFSHEIKRRLLLGREVMTNLDSIFKCRNITLPTKVMDREAWRPALHGLQRVRHDWATSLHFSEVYGFSSGHEWMWELDCEEGWVPKNWCFWTVLLEKTLEGPLDSVHSEGDQPWDFFGGNDAKAETPVLWPPHVKSWLIGKDSDAGRD